MLSDDDDRGSKISSESDSGFSQDDLANFEEHNEEDTDLKDVKNKTPQINLKEGICTFKAILSFA